MQRSYLTDSWPGCAWMSNFRDATRGSMASSHRLSSRVRSSIVSTWRRWRWLRALTDSCCCITRSNFPPRLRDSVPRHLKVVSCMPFVWPHIGYAETVSYSVFARQLPRADSLRRLETSAAHEETACPSTRCCVRSSAFGMPMSYLIPTQRMRILTFHPSIVNRSV